MSEKKIAKPIALAVGVALAGSFASVEQHCQAAETVESPFAMSTLTAGYMLSAGEGSCGGDKGARKKAKRPVAATRKVKLPVVVTRKARLPVVLTRKAKLPVVVTRKAKLPAAATRKKLKALAAKAAAVLTRAHNALSKRHAKQGPAHCAGFFLCTSTEFPA